jgi:aromatic ring-opening dioxygenase LigB subunit
MTLISSFAVIIALGLVAATLNRVMTPVHARIEGAVILPHGDAAYDPTIHEKGTPGRQAANAISAGAHQAEEWLSTKFSSDTTVFLSTPHGIALSNEFGVFLNAAASGRAEIGKDLHDKHHDSYTILIPPITLNRNLSQSLLEMLKGENVTGISLPDEPADVLRWAEVIPTLLIPGSIDIEHVIWTHPLRRYDMAPAMVPELLRVGNMLGEWMEEIDHDFLLVMSGDMSHTHQPDGPYGYSNTSPIMDEALGRWANGNLCDNADHLLVTASSLQNQALSCGFTGFVLLHGMLCGENGTTSGDGLPKQNKAAWNSTVLVNRNATYFGMMAATLARREDVIMTSSGDFANAAAS